MSRPAWASSSRNHALIRKVNQISTTAPATMATASQPLGKAGDNTSFHWFTAIPLASSRPALNLPTGIIRRFRLTDKRQRDNGMLVKQFPGQFVPDPRSHSRCVTFG